MKQAEYIANNRDPFASIRTAKIKHVADSIKDEPADIVALVISELPMAQSTQLLPLLNDDVRERIVSCLTSEKVVPAATKIRVAQILRSRLDKMVIPVAVSTGPDDEEEDEDEDIDPRERHLRKIALLLRGIEINERTEMLKELKDNDSETADMITSLMVAWEDVQKIEDRTMQEILRSVAPTDLAVALSGADDPTVSKVRENLSQRVKEALDEETAFLNNIKKEDILKARSSIIDIMRDLNAQNMLLFEEEEE